MVTDLTREDVVNILSTALYGSYFFQVDNTTKNYKEAKGECIEDKLADCLMNKKEVIINDVEEDESYTLTLHKLKMGVTKYINDGGNANIDDWDYNDADCVLQIALFGEVIYA